MKHLIINADDFGLSDGVSDGIVEAIRAGVVSSTTAMVAVPGAVERIARFGLLIPGRVGLHLQLTSGTPCASAEAVPSLVERQTGRFPESRDGLAGIRTEDIAIEWRAQVERFATTGLVLSHIDSHHHVHHQPQATPAYVDLASDLGVPARAGPAALRDVLRARGVACADRLETAWFGGDVSPARFLRIVERAFGMIGGRGTVELMCHPGRSDTGLGQWTRYTGNRERELEVLTSREVADGLLAMDVEVVPFSALVTSG